MTNLAEINSQLRALLDDSNAKRYTDSLLDAAIVQTLEEISQRLPGLLSAQHTVTIAGRDQVLSALTGCRYIVSIIRLEGSAACCELEPETSFTYLLLDGVPTLHFLGGDIPNIGETLIIHYAANYTLEGLAGQSATTLPATLENALVIGAAAQACFIRATNLVESYGLYGNESKRLEQVANGWRATFERTLNGLKTLQEFGFPPGFPLDLWDPVRQ